MISLNPPAAPSLALDFEFPTFHFTVFRIHAEQVSCKQGRFVTACSATYFEYGIAVVLRVGRDKQELYLLFDGGNLRLTVVQFFTGHFTHFGIILAVQYFPGLIYISQ